MVCRQTDRTCVFGGLLCRSVRCVFSGGIRIDLVFRPPRGSPSIDFSGARRSYKKGRAARAKFGFRRGPSDLVFLNSSKHSTQFLARRLDHCRHSLGADRLLVARAERNCTASQRPLPRAAAVEETVYCWLVCAHAPPTCVSGIRSRVRWQRRGGQGCWRSRSCCRCCSHQQGFCAPAPARVLAAAGTCCISFSTTCGPISRCTRRARQRCRHRTCRGSQTADWCSSAPSASRQCARPPE